MTNTLLGISNMLAKINNKRFSFDHSLCKDFFHVSSQVNNFLFQEYKIDHRERLLGEEGLVLGT